MAAVLKPEWREQRQSRQTEDPWGPWAGKDGDGDGWSQVEVGRTREALRWDLPAGMGVG